MTLIELSKFRQDLAGLIDQLFNKVVSGTSIQTKEYDRFYDIINSLSIKIGQFTEQVALEKCKALNDATKKAFTLMENDISKKFEELEKKIESLNK